MEESINGQGLLSQLHREFGVKAEVTGDVSAEAFSTDIRTYSPLTLAYIGDAVFEVIIRTLVVEKGQRASNTLHKHTTGIVCAQTQARMIEAVYDNLTGEEQDIYRRGKNAKTNSSAKNASLSDYHKATGFEALCGYLFLKEDTARLLQIIRQALEAAQIEL